MKSALNIPKVIHGRVNMIRNFERTRKLDISCIIETHDQYFGDGYELWEFNMRHVISKDLGTCYRVHNNLLKNNLYYRNYSKNLYK